MCPHLFFSMIHYTGTIISHSSPSSGRQMFPNGEVLWVIISNSGWKIALGLLTQICWDVLPQQCPALQPFTDSVEDRDAIERATVLPRFIQLPIAKWWPHQRSDELEDGWLWQNRVDGGRMGVGMRQVRQPLLLCGGAACADAGSGVWQLHLSLSLKVMALPSLHCEANSSNVDKLLSYHGDENTAKSYPGAETSLLCQWDFLRNNWPEQQLDQLDRVHHVCPHQETHRVGFASIDVQRCSREGWLLPYHSAGLEDLLGPQGPFMLPDLVHQEQQP